MFERNKVSKKFKNGSLLQLWTKIYPEFKYDYVDVFGGKTRLSFLYNMQKTAYKNVDFRSKKYSKECTISYMIWWTKKG